MDDNIDLHAIRQFMINEWKLQSANIVIPVLSGITNHKPFKNLKMTEKLKSGIKNVGIKKKQLSIDFERSNIKFRRQMHRKFGLLPMVSMLVYHN